MIKTEALAEQFNALDTDDKIYIHNEYCDAVNDYDNRIESMDNFDEMWGDSEPYWIACRVFFGDFNPNHTFYRLNGYGNFVSFDNADDKNSPIDVEAIVEWLADGGFNEFDNYFDSATLIDDFINEMLPEEDATFALNKIEKICEEETFDVLTENWCDLADAYKAFDYTEGE